MKSVFVTGATGFIGRHILPIILDMETQLHAAYFHTKPTLKHSNLTWHKIDLHDHQTVDSLLSVISVSHLLHSAWYAKPDEYRTSEQNILWLTSSLHLVQCFKKYGGQRAVFVGSCAEYDWEQGHCHETETPCVPDTLYGTTKYALYMLIKCLYKRNDISIAWARLFFLFGAHEYPQRLIPAIISSLLTKKNFVIKNGEQIRDFLFVEDAAHALATLLNSNIEGAINIASGKPISIRQLTTVISQKLAASDLVEYQKNTETPHLTITAHTERLNTELQWKTLHSLETALDKTIEWWSRNR